MTYQPNLDRLNSVIEAVAAQVQELVVVDNGSASLREIQAVLSTAPNARLVPLNRNMGIGTALNTGVEHLLDDDPDWILTLDQDTVVNDDAVATLLDQLAALEDELRQSCGVLAMSRPKPPVRGYRRRWLDSSLVIRELDRFRELQRVIASGNLVRADIFSVLHYNEEFFMDQVDTLFCADVRRLGLHVLEFRDPLMDHRLGITTVTRRGLRTYEGGIRLYYISRNAFSLVLRRDLPLRIFINDLLGLSIVYVSNNGLLSILTLLWMVMTGVYDGMFKRFGPRDDRLRQVRDAQAAKSAVMGNVGSSASSQR
ncbi:MAG: glycosyltransferase [Acidimicrobiales bacterium]